MRALKAADLFCGAGGTSTGAESSGAARVVCAVNHWQTAVETHSRNFPHAKHINSRLDQVKPGECPKIDLLFASPECTHHSRARGGRPTSDQQRSGAWEIMPWIEHHRPSFVVIENVREFADWGPVGNNGRPLESKRGAFFAAWVNAIQAAGYKVDHHVLNAADFAAATSRERLFVIARKGNRSPVFPDPTHGRRVGGELPGFGLHRWRAAAEVIDWSIPCRSVFSRGKPLADKTLARIEAGLRRFVGPFVVELRQHSNGRSLGEPIGTLTAGGTHHGLAFPFLSPFFGERNGQSPRSHSLADALPAVTGQGAGGLCVPFLADVNHGDARHANGRTQSIADPLGTVTSSRGKAVAVPFLVSYYGNGEAYDVRRPLGTVTTKDRCGLVYATVELAAEIEPRSEGERKLIETMRELGVADIGFRMLSNPELSAAQGFPADYWFAGTKADVTKQIGNSVSPVAEAITKSLTGERNESNVMECWRRNSASGERRRIPCLASCRDFPRRREPGGRDRTRHAGPQIEHARRGACSIRTLECCARRFRKLNPSRDEQEQGTFHMSERMFPLQPSRNQNRNPLPGPLLIPWSVAEKAYGAYAAEFGRGQSLQRLAERGGFGVSEMDSLYPQWREEVDEITRLRKLLADYEDCKDAIEVLRDVGRAIGCGHTEDADGRSQIPRCIRETVERLENEIHALKTADMSGSGI